MTKTIIANATYTTPQAAECLGVNRRKITKLIAAGEIEAKVIGRTGGV